mmetsp:Transcript_23743/g.42544  ORF Transcript_23743/g.42544 Transcript_23743/m.42544 type:complete len:214 (+) Transcript_23743:669-1310(+)
MAHQRLDLVVIINVVIDQQPPRLRPDNPLKHRKPMGFRHRIRHRQLKSRIAQSRDIGQQRQPRLRPQPASAIISRPKPFRVFAGQRRLAPTTFCLESDAFLARDLHAVSAMENGAHLHQLILARNKSAVFGRWVDLGIDHSGRGRIGRRNLIVGHRRRLDGPGQTPQPRKHACRPINRPKRNRHKNCRDSNDYRIRLSKIKHTKSPRIFPNAW